MLGMTRCTVHMRVERKNIFQISLGYYDIFWYLSIELNIPKRFLDKIIFGGFSTILKNQTNAFFHDFSNLSFFLKNLWNY